MAVTVRVIGVCPSAVACDLSALIVEVLVFAMGVLVEVNVKAGSGVFVGVEVGVEGTVAVATSVGGSEEAGVGVVPFIPSTWTSASCR